MRDLYKRLSLLSNATREQIEFNLTLCADARLVEDARAVLLDEERRKVYDQNRKVLAEIGVLRARLVCGDSEFWQGSYKEDFTKGSAMAEKSSYLEFKRKLSERAARTVPPVASEPAKRTPVKRAPVSTLSHKGRSPLWKLGQVASIVLAVTLLAYFGTLLSEPNPLESPYHELPKNWLRTKQLLAADKSPIGQFKLGKLYEQGHLGGKDIEKALVAYEKSIELGDQKAKLAFSILAEKKTRYRSYENSPIRVLSARYCI